MSMQDVVRQHGDGDLGGEEAQDELSAEERKDCADLVDRAFEAIYKQIDALYLASDPAHVRVSDDQTDARPH